MPYFFAYSDPLKFMRLADSFLTETKSSNWRADLKLHFAAEDGHTTRLIERRHFGPLRVQKTLYPEGRTICHAILLHPPAGIAGGDELNIDVRVGANAHAVLTTPGAAKWYKAHGRTAHQTIKLTVEEGGHLDWLPLENILFDGAQAEMRIDVDCAEGASAIGWDACMLGRQAASEEWKTGLLHNRTTLRHAGRLNWAEQFALPAASPLRHSRAGLNGFPVFANLWAFGPQVNESMTEALSEKLQLPWHDDLRAGLSCLRQPDASSGLLLLRVLGQKMEVVHALLRSVWMQLRPLVHGVEGKPLRIWAT